MLAGRCRLELQITDQVGRRSEGKNTKTKGQVGQINVKHQLLFLVQLAPIRKLHPTVSLPWRKGPLRLGHLVASIQYMVYNCRMICLSLYTQTKTTPRRQINASRFPQFLHPLALGVFRTRLTPVKNKNIRRLRLPSYPLQSTTICLRRSVHVSSSLPFYSWVVRTLLDPQDSSWFWCFLLPWRYLLMMKS